MASVSAPVTLDTLKNKLLTLGIPGLFLISFLDSAGVPLPGGIDLLVMLKNPSLNTGFVLPTRLAR